jgi:anti-sigma B factor antagonist
VTGGTRLTAGPAVGSTTIVSAAPAPGISVEKSVVDSVAVIRMTGDLDARSADLAHAEVSSIMPAHAQVLLDLSGTKHVTGAGLRTLLLLYRQGKGLDSTVALVGLSAELRNVLFASGFLGFFRVADTVTDGIALLSRVAGGRERSDG